MCLVGDKCHRFLIYFDCQMVSVVKTMKKERVKNVFCLPTCTHTFVCFVQIHVNVCTFGGEYNFRLVGEFVFSCCSSKLP